MGTFASAAPTAILCRLASASHAQPEPPLDLLAVELDAIDQRAIDLVELSSSRVSVEPAMPDWAPPNRFGGYRPRLGADQKFATLCACDSCRNVHGHAHLDSWGKVIPASDAQGFWGALGCSCFAVWSFESAACRATGGGHPVQGWRRLPGAARLSSQGAADLRQRGAERAQAHRDHACQGGHGTGDARRAARR